MFSSAETVPDPAQTGAGAPALVYDEEYFRSHLGPLPYDRSNVQLVTFFAAVADQIIRSLQPKTVLDAGCAMGFLIEAFWDRGIEAYGIDISPYAISNVRRDIRPYCRVASLTEPVEGTYDVVTCIEVLEHMPEADALGAIDRLTAVTDTILFSSSSTDFQETTHINVRQPIWWLDHFQRRGFVPDVLYDAGFVTPWTMLLRRSETNYSWQVLRLFSEWLRYKSAVVARDQAIERLNVANQEVAAQVATVSSQRESAVAERERLQAEIARVTGERDAAIAEIARYREEETEVKAEMLKVVESVEALQGKQDSLAARFDSFCESSKAAESKAERSASAAVVPDLSLAAAPVAEMLTATQAALERLTAQHQLLLASLEDVSRQRDGLLARMQTGFDATAAATSTQLANGGGDARWTDLASQVAALSRGQQMLQEHVSTLRAQVAGVLGSRIWRSLVAAGGVLLRLKPGNGR